jgi:hypothetical protein
VDGHEQVRTLEKCCLFCTWNSHTISKYELDQIDGQHDKNCHEVGELSCEEERQNHKGEMKDTNPGMVEISLISKAKSQKPYDERRQVEIHIIL